jgi:hypothetical protein
VLRDYLKYYHEVRTHLGLSKDTPIPRHAKSTNRLAALAIGTLDRT